jgi:heme exporter protein B
MMAAIAGLIRRDLLLAMRQRGDVLNVLLFFFVVVTLVPLGVGPERNTLRLIAPGIVWVAALLASIMSLPRLFAQDHADGSLEQLLMSGQPGAVVAMGKIAAHWLVTGAPITLAALPLSVMFDLDAQSAQTLALSLLLGTPALSLIGAIGAALTLGLRGGGVLVTLIVLPICVPILIFGAGAVDTVAGGLSAVPNLLLLGGISLGACAMAPWAVVLALRLALE